MSKNVPEIGRRDVPDACWPLLECLYRRCSPRRLVPWTRLKNMRELSLSKLREIVDYCLFHGLIDRQLSMRRDPQGRATWGEEKVRLTVFGLKLITERILRGDDHSIPSRPNGAASEPGGGGNHATAGDNEISGISISLVNQATGLIDPNLYLSCTDLAEKLGVPKESLRKRLYRLRLRNLEVWQEVTDRRPREPRFIYQVSSVLPIIMDLKKKASGEASVKRPAK